MGWAFVKRRMIAELGADWQSKFAEFEHQPAAAASLGQVHSARAHDGTWLACKLQYPDMQSAVEADLKQLNLLFALHRRMEPAIDTTEIAKEIGARIREELDYVREAKHVALYREMLADTDLIRVPRVWPELSTAPAAHARLARGQAACSTYKDAPLEDRNRLAQAMFTAWWFPFSRFGVIHGDPHLGNYTRVRGATACRAASICSIMAASAFSRRASSAAWSISITACATTMRRWSSRPTRPGASAISPAS